MHEEYPYVSVSANVHLSSFENFDLANLVAVKHHLDEDGEPWFAAVEIAGVTFHLRSLEAAGELINALSGALTKEQQR